MRKSGHDVFLIFQYSGICPTTAQGDILVSACYSTTMHNKSFSGRDQSHSKQVCKDQESIQSSTTPNLGYQWESNKLTVKHHKREPRGQPFPGR